MSVLETNDNLSVAKLDLPTELRTALNLVDERMRVGLLIEAGEKYQLSDEDFAWLLVRGCDVELSALAQNTGRFLEVLSYMCEHLHLFRLRHVLDLAMAMKRADLATNLAKECLTTRSLSEENRDDCLAFLQMYCLGKVRLSQPLSETDRALFHFYLSHGTRNTLRANLDAHLQIATEVGDTTSIENVWRTHILHQEIGRAHV